MVEHATPSTSDRIGIFGGTFDPPHVGHLAAAAEAGHALGIDLMLLMVANEPWQKGGRRIVSDAEDRLAMVTAAVRGVAGLEASRLEIDRGGPSYTVDTLEELRRRQPDADLFVVVGADAAAGLATWKQPDDLSGLATLVVVDRPGVRTPIPDGVPWQRVEVPRLEVSSTDLRSRVAAGRPIDFLVPPGVVTCISERRLYRVGG